MVIDDLANHVDLIPELADWHQQQWAYLNPGETLEQRIARMHGYCEPVPIPSTFIALEAEVPLGSAALVAHDMDTHPDLSPWLASVFVAPQRRRQGIGSALVRRVVEAATALDVETLYLCTPDREDFYASMGWRVRSREEYRKEHMVVMELDLSV